MSMSPNKHTISIEPIQVIDKDYTVLDVNQTEHYPPVSLPSKVKFPNWLPRLFTQLFCELQTLNSELLTLTSICV